MTTHLLLTMLLVASLISPRCTVAEERLFEQEPFDHITLDRHNNHEVLRVKPLERPLPRRPEPRKVLIVRLVEEPENKYQLKWRSIVKVDLFEEMVLAEANKLAAAGKREEAYDYFAFLTKNYPYLEGLNPSTEKYLFEEARFLFQQQQYDGALAMLRELHGLNPDFPRLELTIGVTTKQLVQRYWDVGNYRTVHKLLENLGDMFPDHAVIAEWHKLLQQKATATLSQARRAAEASNFAKAEELSRNLSLIWPQMPGARQLALSIHKKHPRVQVGVATAAVAPQPVSLGDWSARRSGRLLYRTLTEYVRPGTDGGHYVCPVGKITLAELDKRISLQLRPGIGWASGQSTLTGNDVARRLLAISDPASNAYKALWAEIFYQVAVTKMYRVEIELRRPFVRPDALLQTVLVPYGTTNTADEPPLPNGPYSIASHNEVATHYLRNPEYFAAEKGMPKEIIERHFPTGTLAIRSLIRGDIQILDRLNPWKLNSVRKHNHLVVQRYALPLVHCLIPNMRKPLLARRTFRRALAYGIQREAILNQITGGVDLAGCRLLSGPFPAGVGFDDPLGYGYDSSIKPRPYDPRLAVALANISLRELSAPKNGNKKPEKPQDMPELILAHPQSEMARVVCSSIKRQLELLGIPIQLKELTGLVPMQIPEDVDLMYAELVVWEPLVDARPLLGEDGMAAGCSPYMSRALWQLGQSIDWQQIHERLHRIHQLAFHDVAVVPLWQLTNFFAYHRNIKGIGEQPISLYQHVEQWRPSFEYPNTQ